MQRFLRLPFELRLGKNRIKEHTMYIGMKAPRTKVKFKLGKCSTVQAKQGNASPPEYVWAGLREAAFSPYKAASPGRNGSEVATSLMSGEQNRTNYIRISRPRTPSLTANHAEAVIPLYAEQCLELEIEES
jgi:hypothetical protein